MFLLFAKEGAILLKNRMIVALADSERCTARASQCFPHLRSRRQEVRRTNGGLAQSMRPGARGTPSVSDERVVVEAPRAEESPGAALTMSCATGHSGCCRR